MNNKFNYILYEARNFAKTYKLLKEQLNSEEEQIPYMIPSIVVITFCIELYLKAILNYYNIKYATGNKGHKLDYLFNLLLKSKNNGAYNLYINIEKLFEHKKKELNNFFLYNNLEEMLEKENNSFEMWRYYFDDWDDYRAMFPAQEFKILLDCLEGECQLLEKKVKELDNSE